jgi:hypothetical protein
VAIDVAMKGNLEISFEIGKQKSYIDIFKLVDFKQKWAKNRYKPENWTFKSKMCVFYIYFSCI